MPIPLFHPFLPPTSDMPVRRLISSHNKWVQGRLLQKHIISPVIRRSSSVLRATFFLVYPLTPRERIERTEDDYVRPRERRKKYASDICLALHNDQAGIVEPSKAKQSQASTGINTARHHDPQTQRHSHSPGSGACETSSCLLVGDVWCLS